MMKSLHYIAAAAIIAVSVFSSCEKAEEQQLPPVLTLSVTGETITVQSAGGTVSIPYKVTNPVDGGRISATASADWIDGIDVSSRENEILLEVSPNPGDGRSATVKVSYTGADDAEITLSQMAAGEDIRLSQDRIDADFSGTEAEIEVTSDRDWELVGEYSWITASASSGKSGDKVTFCIEENTSDESREAEFTFVCASKSVSLTITQAYKTILQSIPDQALRSLLLSCADTDGDGEISKEEATALKSIDYQYREGDTEQIQSLEGLSHFTGLERILLPSHSFSEADFSMLPDLSYVDLSLCSSLETLNIKGCSKLEYLTVALTSSLKEVDLEGCSALKTVIAYGSGISTIDVSVCPALESLTLYSTKIQSLDLTSNSALVSLSAGCETLTSLKMPETNILETLSLSGATALKSVDLSTCSKVKKIDFNSCVFTEIDVTKCSQLNELNISFCRRLTSLDVSQNLHLSVISATNSGLNSVTMFEGQWEEIQGNCWGIQQYMIKTVPLNYPEDCSASITDSGLRSYILKRYDSDGDGKISGIEAQNVTEITYSNKGLKSFSDLVYFRNIEKLDLSNNELESVDVGVFINNLVELNLSGNRIGELSFTGGKNLKSLDISGNGMTLFSMGSDKQSIENVNASNNKLTTFNCSYATSLKTVDLSNNELTACDLQYCSSLTDLNVSHNHLTQETSSFVRPFTFTSIESLDISYNDFVLTESDVTWTDKWTELKFFICKGCAYLQEVNLSPNMLLISVDAQDCPRLSRIILSSAVNPQVLKGDNTTIERR